MFGKSVNVTDYNNVLMKHSQHTMTLISWDDPDVEFHCINQKYAESEEDLGKDRISVWSMYILDCLHYEVERQKMNNFSDVNSLEGQVNTYLSVHYKTK
jgi:hypothetical protein